MNKKLTYCLIFLYPCTFACETPADNKLLAENKIKSSQLGMRKKDSLLLPETFNQQDAIVNDYLKERLQPIRENFKRINSITKFTDVVQKDLWETTEGGIARYYYSGKKLEKITTRHFGENFQVLTEYYLQNGRLSFVYEKTYNYNRPMYQDSVLMKEINDTVVFEFDKSKIIEDRSYFEKRKLIHQINSEDCGSPFSDDYLLEEEKQIKAEFEKLIKLTF
jgi:hypothetical protein